MSGFGDNVSRLLGGKSSAPKVDPAAIHISQVGDEVFNQGSPGATANCGPASLVMTLRLLGVPVPGEDRFSGEDLVLYVRQLATGSTDRLSGTHNLHLQRVLEQAGVRWEVVTHPKDQLRRALNGQVVIMGGNPTAPGCYTARYDYLDVRRWDAGHWIVVHSFDPNTKTFTVNDPQSTIGPIQASVPELIAFADNADGRFGIACWR